VAYANSGQDAAVLPPPAQVRHNRRRAVLRFAAVALFAAAITAAIVDFEDHFRALSTWGYPGVFLVSFLANATVLFPAPGLAFTFAMGSVLHPALVGLIAGLGESLGEIVGYAAGSASRDMVDHGRRYRRIEGFTRRYGCWAVMLLAFIPAGVFDFVGLVSGAMGIPLWRFLFSTWVGKTAKTVLFAYAGVYSITWVIRIFSR